MNGESASTCLSASIQDLTGRATDSELAGNSRKVSSAGILQRLRHEPIAVAPGANGCLALRSSAAQRTLIVIVLELPAAPLLSVTVSLDLNVPVFRYTCGLMPEIAPAFAILPFVALPSPQSRL